MTPPLQIPNGQKISCIAMALQMSGEAAGHEDIVIEAINRELLEADEANFLEEDDMHVFGFMPLIDPLHLVCCNSCKKPIKASQFASHSVQCQPLDLSGDANLVLEGCSGRKKPPRKGRKKSQAPHDSQFITRVLEKPESFGTDKESAPSNFSVFPAPLATKMYHLRSNYRLRTALTHIYQDRVARDACRGFNSKLFQENKVDGIQDNNAYNHRVPD